MFARIFKYNPHHSPKDGKFTSGPSGPADKLNPETGYPYGAVIQGNGLKDPFAFDKEKSDAQLAANTKLMDAFFNANVVNDMLADRDTVATLDQKMKAIDWQLANGDKMNPIDAKDTKRLQEKFSTLHEQYKALQAGDLTKLDPPDVAEVLTKKTEEYWDGLTAEQQNAFLDYTGSDYRTINRAGIETVEKQKTDKDYVAPEYAEKAAAKVRAMDSAFSNCGLPDNVTVYRALDIKRRLSAEGADDFISQAEMQSYVGKEFIDHQFASSSLRRNEASSFLSAMGGRVLMKINLPKGAKAIPLTARGRTATEGELEVLIHRNSKFRITGVSTDDTGVLLLADYIGPGND